MVECAVAQVERLALESAGGRWRSVKGRDNCYVTWQFAAAEAEEAAAAGKKRQGRKIKGGGLLALRKVRVKIGNPQLRQLTIRTHLMVGSCGAGSMAEVFHWIIRTEGWTGLFHDNAVNVLHVAPSKAIEKCLTPEDGELAKIPIPVPLVAGVAPTLCTYPMELVNSPQPSPSRTLRC
uniref:Uncharacterized protein n=1 Tax=Oryza rufipogon TaxID=4529 RepID=A0A0E0P532_ORYRU